MAVLNNKECPYKSSCKRFQNGNTFCENTNEVCNRYLKLYWLHKNALLPPNQCTNFVCKIYDNGIDRDMYKYLSEFESNITQNVKDGKSLYIFSKNVGNGKTSWSIRLLNSYLLDNWAQAGPDTCMALFISVPKFLIELKNSFSQKNEYVDYIKSHVYDAPIVVWDEVGSKCGTDFEREILLNLINDRIYNNKSNIFTSNVNGDELETLVGQRLYSRIYCNSIQIEFNGIDKRGLI